MKPNVSQKESYVRIGVGIVAGLIAMRTKSKIASTLLGAVAASGIETGLSRYCPLSDFLGVDNAPELNDSPLHSRARLDLLPTLH
jgi:hypothetical protein